MSAQDLLVYQNRLAVPFFLGFRHFCHGADQAEVWIRCLQGLQSIQEGCVFGPSIGIEKVQLVREPVVIGLQHDAEKRSDSDSPSQEHSRLRWILMQGEGACG